MKVLLELSSPEAQIAIDVYCYRIRKYIGAYLAVLKGVDGSFSAVAWARNAPRIRRKILQGMDWCGIKVYEGLNDNAIGRAKISPPENSPELWVMPVDEDRIVATETFSFLYPTK